MLCYKCGKNQATERVSTRYNGYPAIEYLCKSCYDEQKLTVKKDQRLVGTCSVCGAKWADMDNSLTFGCPSCHKNSDMRQQIDATLNKLHGSSVHVGKSIHEVLTEDKSEYLRQLEYKCIEARNSGDSYLAEQLRSQVKYFRERNEL